jgi:hypothetical protein
MIPSRQEIAYRVFGAWQLARFDAGGKQYFDESPQAALRSFFAAALSAPAFVITQLLIFSTTTEVATEAGAVTLMLVFALYYCLIWVVSPVIFHRICQVIDRERAFFRFLSAINWSGVIAIHLHLVVTVLEAGGIVPEALGSLPGLAAIAYLLLYHWFIARHCLDVSPLAAVGFVALDAIIGVLIGNIALGMVFQPVG